MKPRRSFLGRLFSFGAVAGLSNSSVGAQTSAPAGVWQPLRDPKDDWYEVAGSKRRIFFDCTSPSGVVDGGMFAGNFFNGSKDGYGLEPGDLAVIVGFRHNATCFGYNDAMWSKYGKVFGDNAGP